jgi:MinD superfamily P-loop ATPase
MKQLVILSGKGGTGKTTVAAALAHLASQEMPVVLADADVDAANLELVLDPRKLEEHDFTGGQVAVIDPELCTACDICAEVCRFEAIIPDDDAYRVDHIACEGCASCFYQCPIEAIRMEEQTAGRWFRSDTRFGPLFHAHLFAAQENSGKLVTLVKQQGRLLALDEGRELLIVDAPRASVVRLSRPVRGLIWPCWWWSPRSLVCTTWSASWPPPTTLVCRPWSASTRLTST